MVLYGPFLNTVPITSQQYNISFTEDIDNCLASHYRVVRTRKESFMLTNDPGRDLALMLIARCVAPTEGNIKEVMSS